VLVICPKYLVRYMTELPADHFSELWQSVARCLGENGLEDADLQDIRINAGSFQNLSHLHLKIWVNAEAFERRWREHAHIKGTSS